MFGSLMTSPHESEVVQISGGVFVHGMGDYREGSDSVHFFLIAVKKNPEDTASGVLAHYFLQEVVLERASLVRRRIFRVVFYGN